MRIFQRKYAAAVILLLLLLAAAQSVCAQRVALLPMADFSRGVNGINLPFTQVVADSLARLGVEMVPNPQVLNFMAENKVRSFSYLDSFLVKKIGKDLQCAVVLLGTVTEIGGRNPSLGLTFTALDTVSGTPIWSETGATSVFEQYRLLALGQPDSVGQLADPLLDQLLLHLGGKIEADAVPNARSYQLTGMQIFPAYVRARQKIDASLKIRFLGAEPSMVAVQSRSGRTYLQKDKKTGIYRGDWFAPDEEGQYPLELVLEWGASRSEERIENIASFQVINKPPGLKVEVKKAQQVDGYLAFRQHVLLLSQVLDLKPQARWALEIRNDEDFLLTTQEFEGDIPERMVWEGMGGDGFMMADGEYEVTLRVWDLAGNESSDSCTVVMQRNAPNVVAEVLTRRDKRLLKVVAIAGPIFPLVDWSLELVSQSGQSLLKQAGTELPQTFEFVPAADAEKVFFSFSGRDKLGNRRRIAHKELFLKQEEAVIKQQKIDSWVPDF